MRLLPAQVAGVRAPVLPGYTTCARGGGVQQPCCLGGGSALRGITPSAQNRKYLRLQRPRSALSLKLKFISCYILPQGEPRVENPSEPKVCNTRCENNVESLKDLPLNTAPNVCQDGDLRQALLQWKVEDHNRQHARLHEQNRLPADHLHVQRRLPESAGRDVSCASE